MVSESRWWWECGTLSAAEWAWEKCANLEVALTGSPLLKGQGIESETFRT